MKIGFHVSVSQGYDATLDRAEKLGCEAIQIFVKNPRSWAKREISDDERAAFGRLSAKLPVYAHLSYLPNLAKIDGDKNNLAGLLHESSLCAELGIQFLVVHPGSNPDKLHGANMTAQAVNAVHQNYNLRILIENTAGQGSCLGTTVEEMARIYDGISQKDRVQFCIDTAHLFESGWDIRIKKNWQGFIREFEKTLGPGTIGFFHLNDSKTPAGARTDRHWHIGEGEIGLKFFKQLLNDKKFAHLAGVMETPKMGNMDEVNMKVMRSLLPALVPRPSS
ncbi:MAG: deoxyribonuclease IV [Syntrophorhabdaceae bacterium]